MTERESVGKKDEEEKEEERERKKESLRDRQYETTTTTTTTTISTCKARGTAGQHKLVNIIPNLDFAEVVLKDLLTTSQVRDGNLEGDVRGKGLVFLFLYLPFFLSLSLCLSFLLSLFLFFINTYFNS